MTGVAAAMELDRSGVGSVLVDKGQRPGGRMATRTIGDARFDHGAQHFSVRGEEFARAIQPLLDKGAVGEWFYSRSLSNPHRGVEPRHVGTGGMRSIVEEMATGLEVRTSVPVTSLELARRGVTAWSNDEAVATGRAVIVTPPLPQSLRLLENSNVEIPSERATVLHAVEYQACLAVMATLDQPSGLHDGHVSPDHHAVAWIGDNQHKGISRTPAVTIHSTPEFADMHLEAAPAVWSRVLAGEAQKLLGVSIRDTKPHRWRYSQPAITLDSGAEAIHHSPPTVIAGEVFAEARIEGAFRSGIKAARLVLGLL